MGYPYSAYAVDLAKLRAAAGSKNTRLVTAVRAKCERVIESNTTWFAEKIAGGAPTLDAALSEIIAGTTPKRSKHGFQYGYAVEVLTRHFGKRVDEDELGLGASKAIDPFLARAKRPKLAKLLKAGTSPIPIPAPADFPVIGTLDEKAMAALLAALAAAEPLRDKKVDATGIAVALRSWCARAAKAKRGLVLFAY